jgi:RimJ/RimL family protein N-acetyltransferase
MEIKGEKVILAPIKLKEKGEFYNLVTKSYGSIFWYDKKDKKWTKKENFFKRWNKGYFGRSPSEKGQCFWIILGNKKIGQINYNPIHKRNKNVELDIIIGDKKNMGKGYGIDALRTLIKYLFEKFDINKVWIEARVNNPRAIKAYRRLGFKKEGLLREENYFGGKFVDCIRFGILRKEFLK